MKQHSQSTQKPFLRSKRPVIFWIFMTVAIPTMTALAFYSAGYRYDAATRIFSRTAAISIISLPKDATVTINGAEQKEKTPYIQTFPAGNYNITVSKDRYTTWSKQFTVTSGKSIVIPDTVLFLQQPKSIVVGAKESFVLSPTSAQPLQRATAERLGEISSSITETGIPQNAVQLFEGGSRVIVSDTHNEKTYVLNGFKKDQMGHPIDGVVEHALWLNRNDLLYAMRGELWIYDSEKNTNDLLLRQGAAITSIGTHENESVYYFTDENGLHAVERDPRDRRQQWTILTMKSTILSEVRSGGRIVVMKNTETAELSAYELYESATLF